jgi:hypothetical protein
MYLFKILLFELDLVGNRAHFFLKPFNLFFFSGCVSWESILVWVVLLVHCLLNPLLKVDNFVVDKVLVNFHFFFEVAHFSFIDEL